MYEVKEPETEQAKQAVMRIEVSEEELLRLTQEAIDSPLRVRLVGDLERMLKTMLPTCQLPPPIKPDAPRPFSEVFGEMVEKLAREHFWHAAHTDTETKAVLDAVVAATTEEFQTRLEDVAFDIAKSIVQKIAETKEQPCGEST